MSTTNLYDNYIKTWEALASLKIISDDKTHRNSIRGLIKTFPQEYVTKASHKDEYGRQCRSCWGFYPKEWVLQSKIKGTAVHIQWVNQNDSIGSFFAIEVYEAEI